jgi:glycosyltransferase involved in cell wall biosynthesis
VIPTRNRVGPLRATLASLAGQSAQPAELIVVDSSEGAESERLCQESVPGLASRVRWFRAARRGAAAQRNEGVGKAVQDVVAFMDDDILLEPDCFARLWAALEGDPKLGGVSATITNQSYSRPGKATCLVYRLVHGREGTYAGRVIGPGVNVLPEDQDHLMEVVSVDWLNLGCTFYRRNALPDPPFPDHFTGYSLCEDLTLSLTTAKRGWKLANARTARIFHDSQPGDHKRSHADLAAMELVNRHYVMTRVLGRTRLSDYVRLGIWEAFQVAVAAKGGVRRVAAEVAGKARGTAQLLAWRGR